MKLITLLKFEQEPFSIKLCRCESIQKEDFTIFVKIDLFHSIMFTFDKLDDARDLFYKMTSANIA